MSRLPLLLFSLFVGLWGVVEAPSFVERHSPTAGWFHPSLLEVADARQGECPVVAYERAIRAEFSARWMVSLQRQRQDGGFYIVRNYSGESGYRPDTVLPAHPDLSWFLQIDPSACHWAPGTYRLSVRWVLDIGEHDKTTSILSNAFEVR